MLLSTLTQKGQATIPAEIRKQLGLQAGDKISFEVVRNVHEITWSFEHPILGESFNVLHSRKHLHRATMRVFSFDQNVESFTQSGRSNDQVISCTFLSDKVLLRKVQLFNAAYHQALLGTLLEWESAEDEAAYHDLSNGPECRC